MSYIKEESDTQISPAEQSKKDGNDAFLAKDYTEAIKHYSKSIEYEPDNVIYYSNRSACYAALKNWQNAYEDALLSISKDSSFIKGYYRLASSQIELNKFDDAEITVKGALSLEPTNEVLLKLLRTVHTKKAAASKVVKKVPKKLDEATMKEAMELQEQLNSYNRDLRGVRASLSNTQRESRLNDVTTKQISNLDNNVPLYRSVGKAFIHTSRTQVESILLKENSDLLKAQNDLQDREEYLTRRIISHTNNLKDLVGQ